MNRRSAQPQNPKPPTPGTVCEIDVSEVVMPPWNPRTETTQQGISFLDNSFALFGNAEPMVWNMRTKALLAGNKRFERFLANGAKRVQVWVVDLDEVKERIACVALNNHVGQYNEAGVKRIVDSAVGQENPAGLLASIALKDGDIAKILNPAPVVSVTPVRHEDSSVIALVINDQKDFNAFREAVNTVWAAHATPGEQAGDTLLRLLDTESAA